jgi:hypothetical protein
MIFFSIGLPSRFAEWCDALLLRVVEHQFGHAQPAALNSLEELAQILIKSRSLCLVACCRQPVARLQNEIINSGRPFLVAFGDPRAALRDLIDRSGLSLVDATRAVASSCAAIRGIAKAPNALALRPGSLDDPLAAAAVIAEHLEIPVGLPELAALVDQGIASQSGLDAEPELAWLDDLPQHEGAIVIGALGPYFASFAGDELDRLVWEPELFYTLTNPPLPTPTPILGPIDITGRARCLVYGPYINLLPGSWFVDVVLGFSVEAAGMSFSLEVFAGAQLAHTRLQVTGEQVIESRLHVVIGELTDQPVQIRVFNEHAAFDGRLALGYIAITRQPTIPEETRQRLAEVLKQ